MKYPYAVVWNGKVYPAGAEVPEEEETDFSKQMNVPESETQTEVKPQTEKKDESEDLLEELLKQNKRGATNDESRSG